MYNSLFFALQKVHRRIQEGFDDIRHIRNQAEPKAEDVGQLGWAKPGSEFEGVNFKRAITRTSGIIGKGHGKHLRCQNPYFPD